MALKVTYSEYPPPPDLAPWVACFWRIRGAVDGGAMEIGYAEPAGNIVLFSAHPQT